MGARILDGKQIAGEIREELKRDTAEFVAGTAVTPCLAAILVGEDAASEVYVRNKQRACEKAGIASQLQRLPADLSAADLLERIAQLNADPQVHGILVQLPLPEHIPTAKILDAIHPAKDVDAFHPENVGLLSQGRPRFLPCTPHGVLQLLHRSDIVAAGKHVVVMGRSEIVGKPLAMLLSQKSSPCGPAAANATVTLAHSRTSELAAVTRQADILIAAIGRANFVTAEMVKPGATVVDVGINRTSEGLAGDVDFSAVSEVAGALTPVPGGVGPLTIAMLLYNTLSAAKIQTTPQ